MTGRIDKMYMDRLAGILNEEDFRRVYQKMKAEKMVYLTPFCKMRETLGLESGLQKKFIDTEMIDNYNRKILYDALTEIGYTVIKPDGAFYLFVKSPVEDEKEFCEAAKKYNILIVPGSSFGCPGYVRMAYCVAYETIVNALPKFKELAKEYF